MKEPEIKKFPTEVFCHPYNSKSAAFEKTLKSQYCEYLKDTCNKPRKSEPDIKVGICSVGYKGSFVDKYIPVIICPQRFNEQIVFDTIKKKYLSRWRTEIEWVSEVSIGVGGNVDLVAVKRNTKGEISDFLCIEFQAGGTTGTPYQAVKDLLKKGAYQSEDYPYGINWANEFMKTMMQQVYKKGKIIDYWRTKIVFIIQDIAIDYLKSAVDTSDLRKANDEDPIHFCTFSMEWNKTKWELKFADALSTNLDGINRILGGAGIERYPSVEVFKSNILRKGNSDGVFKLKT